MGSFPGHAIPGSMFILVGVWWMIQTYRRYFRSLRKPGKPYVSALSFPVTCRWCCGLNVDGLTLAVLSFCGILMDIVFKPLVRPSHHKAGPPVMRIHHATMYFFFGLCGLVMMVTPWVSFVPDGATLHFMSFALALAVEALLFNFHLYGRHEVDVLLHTLLLYVIVASVLVVLLEVKYRDSVVLAQCRAFCLILQGTWFWQIGFYLYNPFKGNTWAGPYDMMNMHHLTADGDGGVHHSDAPMHRNMMFMVCSFGWHVAAVFLLVLITGAFLGSRNRVASTFSRESPTGESMGLLTDGKDTIED